MTSSVAPSDGAEEEVEMDSEFTASGITDWETIEGSLVGTCER